MHFSTTSMNRAGILRTTRPNTFPNNSNKDNYIEFFKNIKQAKEAFSHQRTQSTGGAISSKPPIQVSTPRLGASVKNVRCDVNKNEAHVEDVRSQHIDIHDALIFNDVFSSLDSGFIFLKKSENDAMAFLRKEENIRGLDKFFTTLSTPDNNVIAVAKVKQIFVMLKMLSESYTHDGNPVPAEVKKDIQFYVDSVNKYGLKSKSPYAGSLLKGAGVLKAIDARINKNSAEMIAKGLNYDAAIDRMVESKINTVSDKTLRETLLSKWKDISFRESKRVFDRMESVINGYTHFQRIDALLDHQPIKLDLFKDYLQREGAPQSKGSGNTVASKPDDGISKEVSGPTYIFNDYSTTTNDNSIHFNDNSHFVIKENTNQPNEQEVKLPPSAMAAATQHQNFTNISGRPSDHDINSGERSNLQGGRGTEVGSANVTNNSGKRVSEIPTPSETITDQEGYDIIDGINSNGLTENITDENHPSGVVTRGKVDSTLNINAELDARTSVQNIMPPILNNLDASVRKSPRPYLGPFSTGRTGAAQYQQDWQSASVASDSQLTKKNESLTTLSSQTDPVRNSDRHRLYEDKVGALGSQPLAGKNNVSMNTTANVLTAVSSTRERARGAAVLNRLESNAAMVQSSELSAQESHTYMGPNRTGQTGAAEFKRYWQSAKTPTAEAKMQRTSHKPFSENKPKGLLEKSSAAAIENIIELGDNNTKEVAPVTPDIHDHKMNIPSSLILAKKEQEDSPKRTAGSNMSTFGSYMGPGRTGRTGVAEFKQYSSSSNAFITDHMQNTQTSTKRDPQHLVREASVRITENEGMKKTDVMAQAIGAANVPYRGPFWTGRQGAAIKQAYINTDGLTKK